MTTELENMCDSSREFIVNVITNATTPPPEFPKVNIYACAKCGHITYTVDVADGVASMMLPCMSNSETRITLPDGSKPQLCDGQMVSTFYDVLWEDFDLSQIKYEWRYATLPEYKRYKSRGDELANHVADGGLILHPRKNENAPMWTHGGFFVRPDGSRLSDQEAAVLKTGLQTLKEVIRLDMAKTMKKNKHREHQKMLNRHKSKSKRKDKNKKR